MAEEKDRSQTISAVIPIKVDRFIDDFIKDLGSPTSLTDDLSITKLLDESSTRMQIISQTIAYVIKMWLNKGNIIMSVYPEDAMKSDVKRKILGLLETVKEVMLINIRDFSEVLRDLPQTSSDRRDELLRKLLIILTRIESIEPGPGLIQMVDQLLGILHINLPASMMSNIPKSYMGFVT